MENLPPNLIEVVSLDFHKILTWLFSIKIIILRKRRMHPWASSPSLSVFLPPGLSRGKTWCIDTVCYKADDSW
jgi:hypothetical protein